MENPIDEMVKEERNAYYRRWRAENRDKVRKHNQNYWKKRVLKGLGKQNHESTKAGV